MHVKIYKPSKNVMQSGRGNLSKWILEYERDSLNKVEPLMGWTSANDTLNQIKLSFDNSDDAVAFAKKREWKVVIFPENIRSIKPKNYSDNFKI